MDYSYVLNKAVPQKQKLLEYGFTSCADGVLVLKKYIAGREFYVLLSLTDKTFTGEVYETEGDEKYALFDVAKSRGSFVNGLRSQVQSIVDDVTARCFVTDDLKEKYELYLKEHFGVEPDFPFEGSYNYPVYRCPNEKWFAILMNIKFRSLGIPSDGVVWIVNVKCSPQTIASVTDRRSVFPAYHMNKKNWITILLTAVTDFKQLCELTQESYSLVKQGR